jgi:hypothetical protein
MNKRYRPIILTLILIGLVVFFTTEIRYTFTLLRGKFLNQPADAPPPVIASTVNYEPLYQGAETITLDTAAPEDGSDNATALDDMDLQEIADFRVARVAQHELLNIFPSGYNPLQGNGARMYKNIAPGGKWTSAAAYSIANPYCLIILSRARNAVPINLQCRADEAEYSDGRIQEKLTGENADCFFDMAYGETAEMPGMLQVTMVNAYDSGFFFAGIDAGPSKNIKPGTKSGGIAGGLFSQPAAYMSDPRQGKNTISTEDPKGWIALAQRGAPTVIAIKLWRARPASPADRADLLYVISVEP